jgi:hypothetical protein
MRCLAAAQLTVSTRAAPPAPAGMSKEDAMKAYVE